MGAYNSGSVTVTVGAQAVVGSNTNFTTYASVGNIFKLTSENVTYDIAGITSATRLTLSSRYVNTDEQTHYSENAATCTSATKIYSGFLSNTPIIQNTLEITASYVFSEDGAGNLSATPYGSGSIDYDSGYYSLTFTATLNATTDITLTASYDAGNTLNAMPYQIIRDYTTNYYFPESVPSDKNLAYIYTKAVRMIDLQLKTLEDRIASWH